MNVPSNSCLPCRFVSFLGSEFGQPCATSSAGCLRVNRNAKNRHRSTISSPARNVNTLDSRKHHHLRSCRQSVFGGMVVACTGHSCAQHCRSGSIADVVPRRGRPIRKHQRQPPRWPAAVAAAAAVANVSSPCATLRRAWYLGPRGGGGRCYLAAIVDPVGRWVPVGAGRCRWSAGRSALSRITRTGLSVSARAAAGRAAGRVPCVPSFTAVSANRCGRNGQNGLKRIRNLRGCYYYYNLSILSATLS